MGEFKNLNLKQDCIETILNSFEGVEKITKKTNQYEIIYEGKKILLNVWIKGDGTVTLSNKVGMYPEIGLVIAEKIVKDCTYHDKKDINYSIDFLSESDVKDISEYLVNECNCDLNISDIPTGKKFDFKSKQYKDSFSLIHYKNGRLMLQGKPLSVYSHLYEILTIYVNEDEIIKLNNKLYSISINKKDIYTSIEMEMLPNTYSKLCDTTKKIIMSSFVFKNLQIELDDYSCFSFGILKGLESFIKLVLKKNSYTIPDKKTLAYVFDENGLIKLSSGFSISSDDTKKVLKDCYCYFVAQRHGLFHVDNVPLTSRILHKSDDAIRIINNVCKLIEEGSNEI